MPTEFLLGTGTLTSFYLEHLLTYPFWLKQVYQYISSTQNKLFGVSKKEFVAQEANFHKQNYKFQYTVLKLHKSFRLLLQPCSQ